MKTLAAIGLVLGLTAILALLAWQGFAPVGRDIMAMGAGILLLPLIWLPPAAVAAYSWRLLFAAERAPRYRHALQALWAGDGFSTLLPLAAISEEVVKARMLILHGVAGVDASASVVVDKTSQAISLLVWGLIGAVILSHLTMADEFIWAALGGLALLAVGIAGFVLVQNLGMLGGLARLFGRQSRSDPRRGLAGKAAEADGAIQALYRRPGLVATACGIRLFARILLCLEIVLASHLMGHPIGLIDAVVLRSLATALRGAAFIVPNGLGVQEGGLMVLGALLGYPPEFMLALSLATRGRELLIAVPGVLLWQRAEGRALWRRRPGKQRGH